MAELAPKRFDVKSGIGRISPTEAINCITKPRPPFRDCAALAIEAGWSPIPRRAKPARGRPAKDAKRPAIDGWQAFCERQATPSELVDWFRDLPSAHISIACGYGGVIWLDLDTDKPEIVAAYRSVMRESTVARRGAKGRADAYRVVGEPLANCKLYAPNNKPILEILSLHTNVVIPPSMHPETGRAYEWLTERTVFNTRPEELPIITTAQIERLKEVLKPWLRKNKLYKRGHVKLEINAGTLTPEQRRAHRDQALSELRERCADLASRSKPGRSDAAYKAACALGAYVHHGILSERNIHDAIFAACTDNGLVRDNSGFDVEKTIARGLKKASADTLRPLRRPFQSSGRAEQASTAETVYGHAPPTDDDGAQSPPAEPQPDDNDVPEFSEDGLALSFAAKHKDELRYVAAFNKWMFWTGTHWQEEETHLAFDLANKHCRAASRSTKDKKEKASLCDAKTRANVLTLARADRRIAARKDQWNVHSWLLNTPAGIVNLKTGKLMPHDAARYMTKMTTVSPGGKSLKWQSFLDDVTDGNKELQGFLQRVAGYCLTGETTEHALFFCHGKGGNGKGVFLNTITGILNTYARPAPIETFTESKTERHPTDLAGLVGARLVTASETEEGRHWAEAKIKQLTGGDEISARFMRGDFFQYVPNFKLFIVGNHRPQIRNVDDAMRRRFHLIPFTVTIPPEKKNPNLSDELRAEWGAILRWMIDGCLGWQRIGLAAPEDVKAATADYMEAEDSTATWLEEMTLRGAETEQLSALFLAWKRWADFSNIPAGTNKKLRSKLEDRGFKFGKNEKGVFVNGLLLRQDLA